MFFRQLVLTGSKFNMNLIRRISTSTAIRSQSTVSSGIDYSQLVIVDVNDKTGYATLSLNRPPVNSFNIDLMMALSRALDDVQRNNCRGIILTSVICSLWQ